MTISNLDDAKIKLKTRLPAFLITAGFIFLMCSIIAFWNGSVDYRMQLKQKDWTITTATVTFVDTKVEGAKGPHYGHTSTSYNIYYEYSVDDQLYTGIIENQNQTRKIDSSLEIKYNPKSPAESTHFLEPSKEFIVSGSIFAVLSVAFISLSLYWAKKYPV